MAENSRSADACPPAGASAWPALDVARGHWAESKGVPALHALVPPGGIMPRLPAFAVH